MKRVVKATIICFIFSVLSGFAQTPTPTPEAEKMKSDPEYRKKWEEYEKRVAEITEKNKKIAETNAKIVVLLEEGNSAYRNKNYELALKKYNETLALDDYWGVVTVVLNNKAIVLRMIGIAKYNDAIKSKKAPYLVANPYFLEAVNSLTSSLKILSENENAENENLKQKINESKYIAVKELAECYRLLTLTDLLKVPAAIEAYQNYIALEQDPALKAKAEKELSTLKSKTFRLN